MKENIDWSKWNSKEDNFKKYSHIKSNLIYGSFKEQIPEVSIMIITYKRADGLKNALESAINQDYTENYEIVVCDDSGFDQATDDLMKEYCSKYSNIVYYRHEKNLGQYANWNRACELCRTEWYCLLHDDDILFPEYLSKNMRVIKRQPHIGLSAVYLEVNDTRKEEHKFSISKRIVNNLASLFMNLTRNRLIRLSIKDNLKHIYVMNSTFINRTKAYEIGGLDDQFWPSSDFAFAAKMNFYYSTYFLPERLVKKGLGESESLKVEVCQDSIRCAYNQTYAMCRALGYNETKSKKHASVGAVISEIGVKGYNNIDYSDVKNELGMNSIYNNRVIIALINLYSKFNWGLLLFRKSVRG